MPGEYFSDEQHLKQWLTAEQDEAGFLTFLDGYVYGLPDFAAYIDKCGGMRRLQALRQREVLVGDAG